LAKRKNNTGKSDRTSANVGYEAQLWQMADALRGSMDAAEYKHVCLGLLIDLISNIDFRSDQPSPRPVGHPGGKAKADFILANPPFNISDWGGERLRDDKRWHYGAPPH